MLTQGELLEQGRDLLSRLGDAADAEAGETLLEVTSVIAQWMLLNEEQIKALVDQQLDEDPELLEFLETHPVFKEAMKMFRKFSQNPDDSD